MEIITSSKWDEDEGAIVVGSSKSQLVKEISKQLTIANLPIDTSHTKPLAEVSQTNPLYEETKWDDELMYEELRKLQSEISEQVGKFSQQIGTEIEGNEVYMGVEDLIEEGCAVERFSLLKRFFRKNSKAKPPSDLMSKVMTETVKDFARKDDNAHEWCAVLSDIIQGRNPSEIQDLNWNKEITDAQRLTEAISQPTSKSIHKEIQQHNKQIPHDIVELSQSACLKTQIPAEYALAISTYTSNICYSELNKVLRETLTNFGWESMSYNLYRGLQCLPFYWGIVKRGRNELPQDEETYKLGNIVSWRQFNSTSISKAFPGGIQFTIKSITGRHIKQFSPFPHEDEVLIPPAFFKVTKVERITGTLHVNLDEVLYAQGFKVVLFVDDIPEGNKELMELAQKNGVTVVWVKTTQEAEKFFQDHHNWFLFQKSTKSQFRIISDMARKENGNWNYFAGVYVVKVLRESKYNQKVLIYTGKKTLVKGKEGMEKLFKEWKMDPGDVEITAKRDVAMKFVCFK